ncbi:glycine zipper domain-containing protein [Novosphingobium huizhouense]|uniref:glycine zipper domain-containing protein n=1 Tax=Novosphingobium huizhouense TaxID=2866625 RepID=UPI001CD8CC98|nr:glycine zipper domain-containing protein [Novosphingobium huizhouense]
MVSKLFIPVLAGGLALGGCASNYAGEGALAGGAGGALIGAATGGDVATGAAIGAAAGGAVGSLIKKNGRCYRRDANGYEYRVRC